MKRRKFINTVSALSGIMLVPPAFAGEEPAMAADTPVSEPQEVHPGIWKFTFGTPERLTPQSTRLIPPDTTAIQHLPNVNSCPLTVTSDINERGVIISMPLKEGEYLYGLGLQFQSFQQRGLKKKLRVNADPVIDSGDSHAPVPFFVSTAGYGVAAKPDNAKEGTAGWNGLNNGDRYGLGDDSAVLIEVPVAKGVDVYIFGGPSLLNAVQRYNLFSGGGVVPPRWGLGFWYRVESNLTQEEVKGMGNYFRHSKIPCDVLGLEPHWQTHAYSCSYVWSNNFPNPAQMLSDLKEAHFRVNLWEHAFVHPSAPFHDALIPYSGDYLVWDGLVPDFLQKEARNIFGAFHKKEHVDIGVSGYKADECDNSDFTRNWSFPELSRFPSGADGEQMHSLFGLRYQDTLLSAFNQKGVPTYGLVRSSGALAAPYPFVLYSDLYNHRTFIHAVAQSGFTGLLWTPEVRDANSNEDLIRRLQSVIFSPIAMVNAWYLKNAPWKQIEREANNKGQFAEGWQQLEAQCRAIIELRMQLIPYLHAAFVKYKKEGIPPFRALVMDYPNDEAVRDISDQFLVGDNMLVAPVVEGEKSRKIYLPEGDWFHYWSHQQYSGKKEYDIEVPLEEIPVFVRSGTILPLAKATLHTADPESYQLTALVFGNDVQPATLYGSDEGLNPTLVKFELAWDAASKKGSIKRSGVVKGGMVQYSVVEWKVIG